MGDVGAIERCTYCHEYVPVTPVVVEPGSGGGLSAELSVCERCHHDGR